MFALAPDGGFTEQQKIAIDRFAAWLLQGPKLAKAIDLYVKIEVSPAPAGQGGLMP